VAGLITLIHDRCQFSDFTNLASCLRVVGLKYIECCASPLPETSTWPTTETPLQPFDDTA